MSKPIKAMIMAAGVGSRLEPLTLVVPKPMTPLVDTPTLHHIVNLLKRHGINEMAANLWYKADQIQNYFGDGSSFGASMRFIEEQQLSGTAGGVKLFEDFLDETFIVVSGDALTDIEIDKMLAFHREKGAIATIALKEVHDTSQFGIVVTTEDGRIDSFQEKPQPSDARSHMANTGIYIFEPEIFDYIPHDQFYDFGKQLFPQLVEKKAPFYGYEMSGYWADIGSLKQYRFAHYDILRGHVDVSLPKPTRDRVWIGEGCDIHPTVRFEGPAWIGHNCEIGAHAVISEGTVLGDRCVIGSDAKIQGSVLWDDVQIAQRSRLDGVILGTGCRIGMRSDLQSDVVLGNGCEVGNTSLIVHNSRIWPNLQLPAHSVFDGRWRRT